MVTLEGRIKAGCLRYLEKRGIMVWNNPTGAVKIADRWLHFGKKGSADILGCLPGGRLLCVECKAPAGRLSPEQKQFLSDVQKLGALSLVVHGWQELDQAMRAAGYITDGPLFENNLPYGRLLNHRSKLCL